MTWKKNYKTHPNNLPMQAVGIGEDGAVEEGPVVEDEGEDAGLGEAGRGLCHETFCDLNCTKMLHKTDDDDDADGHDTHDRHFVDKLSMV